MNNAALARFREIAAGPHYRYTESGAKAIREVCDEVELLRHRIIDAHATLADIETLLHDHSERLSKKVPAVS
mgnify:CR=1 FL=1